MTTRQSTDEQRTVLVVAHHGKVVDGKTVVRALTGYVVAPGYVLTCAHDVEDSTALTVHPQIDRELALEATVEWVGTAEGLDVALLSVPHLSVPVHAATPWGYWTISAVHTPRPASDSRRPIEAARIDESPVAISPTLQGTFSPVKVPSAINLSSR